MSEASLHPCIEAARELGPKFAERSAAHDRSGEFVADNYADMKERKLMSAGVPEDLGGGGASHAELCQMLRELAHHCPSTALAFSMHTHLVAANVWRHLHGQPAAPLLEKVANGQLVLVSTGAGDWLQSHGEVERVDGGYRVTSKKRFASGSPVGNIALTSAPYEDPEQGWRVLHFPVPLDAEGVTVGSDWDTLGMRATGSHTLTFDRVFVPEAAVGVNRERGPWHPSFAVVATIALPILSGPYVGVAERAAELARKAAHGRTDDPHLPYLMGEMENQLTIAQMALREMEAAVSDYDFPPELSYANGALIRKTLVANATRATVDKAVEATGGGAFFRKHPLEQLWRDIQGAPFHPLPEKKQQYFTGRIAMGLDPI